MTLESRLSPFHGRIHMGILDRFNLEGKVAIITGASSGLGVSFATALAEAGADLVLGARREDRLAETVRLVEEQGRRAVAVRADVTDPDNCRALADRAVKEFGRVDILVNNAGTAYMAPVSRDTPEQFRGTIELNLNSCYWMAQAAGPAMVSGGSIVNVGSMLGLTTLGMPQAAYSASKAGIIGLTRDLAQQWTPRKGIRVNTLAPGYFHSEMTEQIDPQYFEDVVIPRTLFKRLGEHDELSAALLFLVSDASSYISGITLPVEGGCLVT